MKKIAIQDSVYEVPGSWNELSRDQLLMLIRSSEREMSYVELQLKFFLFCIEGHVKEHIGAGMFTIKTRKGKHVLFSDELTGVLSAFDFLFSINSDGVHELSPSIYINHFPRFRSRFTKLAGPNNLLDNITYNDFVWLQTWHSQLSQDPVLIDEFVNVLYKTRKGKQEVKNIARIKREYKTAVLWLFLGTLQYVEGRFPHVFSGSADDAGQVNVFDNQQRIIDSLAGGDVTKKDQVRSSLLYDALYSMEMAAVRIEEMEKKYQAKK